MLTPATLFFTVSLFNSCRLPVTTYFPTAVQSFAEARVSIGRVQAFMELGFEDSRKKNQRDSYQPPQPHQHQPGEPSQAEAATPPSAVTMQSASFKWDANSKETAGLYDLTMSLRPGKLSAIIGAIGCGKSSLLCAMLGEMAPTGGVSTVHANSIAYAAQQAWIFADSLRGNVVMGRPMRRDHYIRTLFACSLIDDIQNLPAGDLTIIGEKGINLSGGQRARVALARAVYGECDLYLFDDCLAALDAVVAQRVFMSCMSEQGLLKGKTRVLVTHQTQFLYRADHLILLESGRIKAQGSWRDMVSQHEVRQAMHVTGHEGAQHKKRAAATKSASPPRVSAPAEPVPALDRLPSSQVTSTVNLLISPSSTSGGRSDEVSPPTSPTKGKRRDEIARTSSILSAEVSTVGTVGWSVYTSMFSISAGWLGWVWVFLVLVFFMVAGQGVSITSDRWLAIWSSQSPETQNESFYEYVYIGLVLGGGHTGQCSLLPLLPTHPGWRT